jgi:NADP-dependent 3-hydroxy acid dehydrogenase YdfG
MSKTILISGASSGFGHLSAHKLADAGHLVYAGMRGLTVGTARTPHRRRATRPSTA